MKWTRLTTRSLITYNNCYLQLIYIEIQIFKNILKIGYNPRHLKNIARYHIYESIMVSDNDILRFELLFNKLSFHSSQNTL